MRDVRARPALTAAVLTGATAALLRNGVRQPGRALPGDRLVRRPMMTRTVSTVLPAPPEDVWPWLAQMGAGRGGWYGFDRIDNGGARSADRVIPDLQRLSPGDALAASTAGGPPFVVIEAHAPRSLVLLMRSRGGRLRTSYAYVLEPVEGGRTRLTARLRMGGRPAVGALIASPLVLAGHEPGQRVQFARLRRRVSARP